MSEDLLFEEIYQKTQDCGRTQFVKLLQQNQIKIEQIEQENRELKKKLYSPDVIDTTCPKCGEKFTTNYSREVYDLRQENKELKEGKNNGFMDKNSR